MTQCGEVCKLEAMAAQPIVWQEGHIDSTDEIREAAVQDIAEMLLNYILARFELPDLTDESEIEEYLDNIALLLRRFGIVGPVPDVLELREISIAVAANVNCYNAVMGELTGGKAQAAATPELVKLLLPMLVQWLIKRLDEYVKIRECGDDSAAVREAMQLCQS